MTRVFGIAAAAILGFLIGPILAVYAASQGCEPDKAPSPIVFMPDADITGWKVTLIFDAEG